MTSATPKSTPLTPVMRACLAFMAKNDGSIERHPGGFWCGQVYNAPQSFGTSTVEALVKRGLIEYVEWHDGRRGRFPVRARIVEVLP